MLAMLAAFGFALSATADTLLARPIRPEPAIDGVILANEYPERAALIEMEHGAASIWIARTNGYIYIAAAITDTSFYWGDDFVISLSPSGNTGGAVQAGDRQWYLRRVLDSSVVFAPTAAEGGRWSSPGREPPMLGKRRSGDDWEVASRSTGKGWTIELRIRETSVKPGAALPRIAFRTYNDVPRGWWSFPAPAPGAPAQRVERTPSLWIPLRFP
jgi:hypothetical protein